MEKKQNMQAIADLTDQKEQQLLSEFGAPNSQATRLQTEKDIHYRPPYALDRDRIMYSGAFRRYTGKTQVIYFASMLDEQLTSRSLHTISVAQISKTIGRFLSLNSDLIEAIALGHDLGHTPFGHDGERFLSKVCQQNGLGCFMHNIQSLRIVDTIAKHGEGLNLTFQTRDGILSHNGEVFNQELSPQKDKSEADLHNYIRAIEAGTDIDMAPATLEGCVVRLSDTIAYIGQDIEDAIRIGLITRQQLPSNAAEILGRYNGKIIETLVNDVVEQSYNKNYIGFSEKISSALYELKAFNYKNIYKSPKLKVNHQRLERGFEILFSHYLQILKNEEKSSEIYKHFLNFKNQFYKKNSTNEMIVRDFIAGMTDRYFTKILEKIIIPEVTIFNNINN